MTRRDFVLIADILKGLGEDAAHCFDNEEDIKIIAGRFADALAQTNPSFDTARFMTACLPNA